MSLNELKEHVSEHRDTSATGQTNVKVDASILNDLKKELGISKNAEVTPYLESQILQVLDREEEAEEKIEEFKAQFEDE